MSDHKVELIKKDNSLSQDPLTLPVCFGQRIKSEGVAAKPKFRDTLSMKELIQFENLSYFSRTLPFDNFLE